MSDRDSGGEGFISLIILGFIVWGIFSTFTDNKEEVRQPYNSDSYSSYSDEKECSEPENSYNYGTGHYAGFEWAENRGGAYCDGNSDSFNEGCEDYNEQLERYEDCVNE